MVDVDAVRLQRGTWPGGVLPAGRYRHRLHRTVRRRPADRLGDPQPPGQGRHQRHLAISPSGPSVPARWSMPASSTGRTSAIGPATSRPTRRATSALARVATRSSACPISSTTPSRAASRSLGCASMTDVSRGRSSLTAFNPIIPMNERDSSIPAAMFEIAFSNPGPDAHRLHGGRACSAMGSAHPPAPACVTRDGLTGVRIVTDEPDLTSADYAELVLATDSPVDQPPGPSVSRALVRRARGLLEGPAAAGPVPADATTAPATWRRGMGRNRDSSLVAAHVVGAAGRDPDGALRHRLVRAQLPQVLGDARSGISARRPGPPASGATGTRRNGTARRRSPSEVLSRWDDLRGRRPPHSATALYESTLPHAVLDAAAANLSILKSPTTLRLEDGTFYGWEGCHPTAGSCEGSCTHVWNYQQTLPFLFPALERSMREADYAYNMDEAGGMSFRLSLPLGTHYTTERPCADGQFGNILKLYRDWKLSGDLDWLRTALAGGQAEPGVRLEPGQPGPLGPRADRRPVGPPAPHARHGAVRSQLVADRLLSRSAEGRRRDGRCTRRPGDGRRCTASIYERGRDLGRRQPVQRRVLRPARSTSVTARVLKPFAEAEVAAGAPGRRRRAPLLERRSTSSSSTSSAMAASSTRCSASGTPRLYGLGDVLDPRAGRVPACVPSTATTSSNAWATSYNPCRVFGLYDESGTIIATWPDAVPQARGAGALRPGDDARHGVRVRPDADAVGMLDEGVRGRGRRSRPLRRRSAESLERDRVRLELRPLDGELGGGRGAVRFHASTPDAATSASIPGCGARALTRASGPGPAPTARCASRRARQRWSSSAARSGSPAWACRSAAADRPRSRSMAAPIAVRIEGDELLVEPVGPGSRVDGPCPGEHRSVSATCRWSMGSASVSRQPRSGCPTP